MYSFNVLTEPWITVLTQEGTLQEMSIKSVIEQAHRIQEVQGTPLEVITQYRLLLALVLDIYTRDPDDWSALLATGKFPMETFETFQQHYADRFDVFHPQYPFYQDRTASIEKKTNQIIVEAVQGNNPTLFNHNFDTAPEYVSVAKAIKSVLVVQHYSSSGGRKGMYSDTPFIGVATFWIRGRSLFEALLFNAPPNARCRYGDKEDLGIPSWKQDITHKKNLDHPEGYLDFLTWQGRKVLLQPEVKEDGQVRVWRIMYGSNPKMNSPIHDPMATYLTDRQGKELPFNIRKDRAVWRDSSYFMGINKNDGKGGHIPYTLSWFGSVMGRKIDRNYKNYRHEIEVFSLVVQKGKDKKELWRHERMPFFVQFFEDNSILFETLNSALAYAEESKAMMHPLERLRKAIYIFSVSILASPDDAANLRGSLKAEAIYWSRLEQPFYQLLEGLAFASDEAERIEVERKWQETAVRVSQEAFYTALEGFAFKGKSMLAYAEAEEYLLYGGSGKNRKKLSSQPFYKPAGIITMNPTLQKQIHAFYKALESRRHSEDRQFFGQLRRFSMASTTDYRLEFLLGDLIPEGVLEKYRKWFFEGAILFAIEEQKKRNRSPEDIAEAETEGKTTYRKNFGHNLRSLRFLESRDSEKENSTDLRVKALLDTTQEDLSHHLRRLVTQIAGKKESYIVIHHHNLLEDVLQWNREDQAVQRKWARAYRQQPLQEATNQEMESI